MNDLQSWQQVESEALIRLRHGL